jgi:hypothetical protein
VKSYTQDFVNSQDIARNRNIQNSSYHMLMNKSDEFKLTQSSNSPSKVRNNKSFENNLENIDKNDLIQKYEQLEDKFFQQEEQFKHELVK